MAQPRPEKCRACGEPLGQVVSGNGADIYAVHKTGIAVRPFPDVEAVENPALAEWAGYCQGCVAFLLLEDVTKIRETIAKKVARAALVALVNKHEEDGISLDAIFHDREGRALDNDPETLWLIGKAEGAAAAGGFDLTFLMNEVQPNPPHTPNVCAACDNGDELEDGEVCPDCGNKGKGS
jgi:hypothetical protein